MITIHDLVNFETDGYKRPTPLSPNVHKDFEGFEISYNPYVNETALIINDEYYILTGDFRKQYGDCNLKQALHTFIRFADTHINGWSTKDKEDAIKLLNEVQNAR